MLSPEKQQLALLAFRPIERLFQPLFSGLDNIPNDRPVVFIGNHQLLSLDVPFLICMLWRSGIPVRTLGDDFLFAVPGIAQGLRQFGVIPASPQGGLELLARGESLLIYPGGAREASKNAGHRHLDWWDRLGFARLACQARCTVIPVAAAGVDENVRIVLPPERYLNSRLGRWADRLGLRRDMFLPLMFPTKRPRPAFHFCPPLRVDPLRTKDLDSAARRLRSETASSIEQGIQSLRARLRTPNR